MVNKIATAGLNLGIRLELPSVFFYNPNHGEP